METLKAKRKLLKSKLTRFENFVNTLQAKIDNDETINDQLISELQKRISMSNSLLSEFESIQIDMFSLPEHTEADNEQLREFEDKYFLAISKSETMIKQLSKVEVARSNSPALSVGSGQSQVTNGFNRYSFKTNLPKINLPKFGGNTENWLEFKAIFKSLVHDNHEINDTQKLHYLKGSLTNEASEVIRALEFTEENYQIAWKTLITRYDQPKLLIKKHLLSIVEMGPLKKESSKGLRQLHDTFSKHTSVAKSLAPSDQLFEALIVYLVSEKLDSITLREWENTFNKSETETPNLDQFKTFLNNQANFLENFEKKQVALEKPKNIIKSFVTHTPVCSLCKHEHSLSKCEIFLKLTPSERSEKVKELKVCFNCLARGHFTTQCSSRYTCRTCRSKHHTLLHENRQVSLVQPETEQSENMVETIQTTSALCSSTAQVLLPLAIADIADSRGKLHPVRILLDSGSQSNFIRTDLVRRLGLPTQTVRIAAWGLNNSSTQINAKCSLEVRSRNSQYKVNLSYLVIDEITGALPGFTVKLEQFKIPDNIQLSDPNYNQASKIDLLIGSTAFFDLLCIGKVCLGPNLPIIQKTRFGWVIAGPVNSEKDAARVQCHCNVSTDSQELLAKFWEIDSYPEERALSMEENECEIHYTKNTRRDADGRFVVSIPLKQPIERLGDSLVGATQRFLALERRLQANPELSARHHKFMNEYKELAHMSLCNPKDEISFYLPHHGALSRSSTPQALKTSTLWWNGPPWLSKIESAWPSSNTSAVLLPELRKEIQVFVSANLEAFPFYQYSNLTKLTRVTAHLLRFRKNCSNPKDLRPFGPITASELSHALMTLVRLAQRESFSEEIKLLENSKMVKGSPLLKLNPFIHSDSIIRVGGRLKHSSFSFDKKYPMLLSGKHPLAKMLVEREHLRMLHAGPQLLLSSLRDKFWIISGRNLVRKTVHSCVKCFRFTPKITEPIMGNLPSDRLKQSYPFHVVGIDYAGPLTIKDRRGRGAKTSKAYICLFVCFSTKAVHLELVTDLTTESFLLSFRRFVSRRGKPSRVYSDNGTNFVGADAELRDLAKFLKIQNKIIVEKMAQESIDWHFIPAQSPHFGGLWESGVKSCKHHLKRVIGLSIFTYEELCTLLAQIESVLNSRPITPLSNDPNDLEPLSPGHFLVGRPLTSLPDPDVTNLPDNRLTYFQRIQSLHQHFWKRWSKEYISELQQRQKWTSHHSDLQMGALVLIKDDNLPPLRWKLGRITELFPGSDGINRVASLKTSSGIVLRSFQKLCPLPIYASET